MSRTWILDGGPKRFVAVALVVFVLVVGATTLILRAKVNGLASSVQHAAAPSSAQAMDGAVDDDADPARPDPLAAARDGLSRWLAGDTAGMTAQAAAAAPVAPVGAAVADGGAVLVNSAGYTAVTVPLTVQGQGVNATVELTWADTGWLISNFIVS